MSGKRNCITDKNWQPQDYRIYRFSHKEIIKYGAQGFLAGTVFLFFFYRTIFVLIMAVPCSVFYCRWKRKQLCISRKRILEQQFRDWIHGALGHLQSGGSVENAFIQAGKELHLLYTEDSDIRKEVKSMEYLLSNNVPLEKILTELGARSCSEDIGNFADVFLVGKRSGGNLRQMIENCCGIIAMKADTDKEIRTMLHGKVMEQKLMCLIPFGIISYINISSPGYFSPLYHNPAGICVMTVCLLFYLFSVWLSMRIVHIEV